MVDDDKHASKNADILSRAKMNYCCDRNQSFQINLCDYTFWLVQHRETMQ